MDPTLICVRRCVGIRSQRHLAGEKPALKLKLGNRSAQCQGLKELGIDHVFYDMNHPAQVPIDTQLVLLRRLVRLIKA